MHSHQTWWRSGGSSGVPKLHRPSHRPELLYLFGKELLEENVTRNVYGRDIVTKYGTKYRTTSSPPPRGDVRILFMSALMYLTCTSTVMPMGASPYAPTLRK